MRRSFHKTIRISVSVLLSILNLVIVIPTVHATANQTSFPLVIVLAAIALVTLVNMWRHAVLDEASTKSRLVVGSGHPFARILDSKGDPCP
jgi:membrane protein YdbS with pleckstrin-like domain